MTFLARLSIAVALSLAGFGGAVPAHGDGDAPAAPEHLRLLDDLGSEAATVRERAGARLEFAADLRACDVAAALRSAPAPARPELVRLAAVRGMRELVPEIVAVAAGADVVAADAALRAVVALGPDATVAAAAALDASDLSPQVRASRRRQLAAFDAQRRVEREVLGRWRRKGGSYRGRYADLGRLGFEVQPVLLAMLLDVPLEAQFLAVPTTGEPELDRARRTAALLDLARSPRRGYRTFDPLPTSIEPEEVFDLAAQALADVADLSLLGEILDAIHGELLETHQRAGWRPRQFEDAYARDIEVILASRGAPARLEERRADLERRALDARRRLRRVGPDEAADEWHYYSTRVSELASVLHQLGKYDEASERYEEVVKIGSRLGGSEPAISNYNRACALARAGRRDEALTALARALDPAVSSGFEDLTREWVLEDGDLESLRDDPRFEAALAVRFGPGAVGGDAPSAPRAEKGEPEREPHEDGR